MISTKLKLRERQAEESGAIFNVRRTSLLLSSVPDFLVQDLPEPRALRGK